MPQKAHSLASDESELEQMYKTYQDLLQQSATAVSMLTKTDSLDTDAGAELDAVQPELKAARHDMRGLHKLEKALKNDSKEEAMQRAEVLLDEVSGFLNTIIGCGDDDENAHQDATFSDGSLSDDDSVLE